MSCSGSLEEPCSSSFQGLILPYLLCLTFLPLLLAPQYSQPLFVIYASASLFLPPSLGETAILYAAIAPCTFQVIASPCSLINACAPNSIFGHTVSSRGKEHVISCTAASVQTPVGTYYCTYVICNMYICNMYSNKLSIQSNSI